MTTLNYKFNNLKNVMIKVSEDGSKQAFPTIIKFRHPFLLLDHVEQAQSYILAKDKAMA